MVIYLVQHAKAVSEEVDPARPLCEKGLADITKTASYLSGLIMNINEIFHSPRLRAKQTALILADYLRPLKGPTGTDGLKPNDDPTVWSKRLKDMTGDIMLVGHLPHLGRLASSLLCGDPDKNIVSFKMAGVVCLEQVENGAWSLQWIITPEIII